MIKFLMGKFIPSYNERYLKTMSPMVKRINELEDKYASMPDDILAHQTNILKEELSSGTTNEHLIPSSFAIVRETSKRTIGLRHFDVQLMGGYVLHKGKISEMKTGEGKTVVAALALYINALEGKGAHLITVNDYLAKRDALWMSPIYLFLGLSVGVIQHEASWTIEWDNKEQFTTKLIPCSRKEAYSADITYGTNNEFGFDYLRDNMRYQAEEYVQSDLNYAIVDEVDSILIDEARTPLIISGPTDEKTDFYYTINNVVKRLKRDIDYTVEEKHKSVKLTDEGINIVETSLKISNLFDINNIDTLHFVNNALKAHSLFQKDTDYVIQNNQVIIVDEFTGRLMPGRRYSEGLHQALEAKEDVTIESENQTLASITFQNYFRMYNKLAGMTGTAVTEASEFKQIYNLDVIVIPTHRPMIREDNADLIYKTTKEKFNAIVKEIIELHNIAKPILVGTVSIEKSEYLSQLLKKKRVPHEVLNAKNHEREAQIIAKAGDKGSVTIATNMAGRGTDIKLGPGVLELGGLHIIGTERHESRRVDNQLRGRSGRQGDMGSSNFFLSLEDDLLRIFGSERISSIMNKLGMKDGEPIEHNLISKAIENAQKKVEGMHFEIRKHLLDYDNVMNQQRVVIYALRKDILQEEAVETILDETIANVIDTLSESYIKHTEIVEHAAFEDEIKKIFDITISMDGVNNKNFNEYKKRIVNLIKIKLQDKNDLMGTHFTKFLKFIMINIIDSRWKDHLLSMDYLRDSVGLRGYGQKDPLIEYKKEAYNIFAEMINRINFEISEFVFHVQIEKQAEVKMKEKQRNIKEEKKDIFSGEKTKQEKREPLTRQMPKIGRNDPCPCGSGKKYKKCCGANE